MTTVSKYFLLPLLIMLGAAPVTAKTPRYSIVISTPTDHVKTGETVIVDAVLRNISQDSYQIESSGTPSWAFYKVFVVKGNGDPAPKTEKEKALELGRTGSGFQLFEPGDRREDIINLNMLYDISAPGTYIIRVTDFDDPPVLSNLIRLTVTN